MCIFMLILYTIRVIEMNNILYFGNIFDSKLKYTQNEKDFIHGIIVLTHPLKRN